MRSGRTSQHPAASASPEQPGTDTGRTGTDEASLLVMPSVTDITPETPEKKLREATAKGRPVEIPFRLESDRLLSDGQMLVEILRDHGLFGEDLGYSGFNPQLIEKVIKTGSYRFDRDGEPRKIVYCARFLRESNGDYTIHDGSERSVLEYCLQGIEESVKNYSTLNYAALAVYDLRVLGPCNRLCDRFTFSPEGFLGVIKLTNFIER